MHIANMSQPGARPPETLSSGQLWEGSDHVNLEAVFIDELMAADGDDPDHAGHGTCRIEPWRDPLTGIGQPAGYVLFEDDASGVRRIMPGSSLRSMRVASLAVLAAHRLAGPGVLTVAILSNEVAPLLEADVIARYVANVSHIAVWPGLAEAGAAIDAARLAKRLERTGTALSMTGQRVEAVRGANLVLLVDAAETVDSLNLEIGHFVRGAVIVNAIGRELPGSLTADIEHIIVDYPGLLSAHPRRYLHGPDAGSDGKPQAMSQMAGHPKPIMTDLLQIMTGTRVKRPGIDDVVLVELLSANSLSTELAFHLIQAIPA